MTELTGKRPEASVEVTHKEALQAVNNDPIIADALGDLAATLDGLFREGQMTEWVDYRQFREGLSPEHYKALARMAALCGVLRDTTVIGAEYINRKATEEFIDGLRGMLNNE